MNKIVALFTITLMGIALISGCIGGGDDDNAQETSIPTTTPASTNPPVTTPYSPESYRWDLYGFEVGDSFTYDVEWDSPDFAIEGTFSLDFSSCASHDYRVHYTGMYQGTMSGTFNSTFNTNEEDFYQSFMQSVVSSNAMISPLFMFTIIAPWWGPYFSENDISLGSNWSITVEGNTSTFSFDQTCGHAGIEGYLGVWTFSGTGYNTTLEACISPNFPLALHSEYRFQEGSEVITYSSQLKEWSS